MFVYPYAYREILLIKDRTEQPHRGLLFTPLPSSKPKRQRRSASSTSSATSATSPSVPSPPASQTNSSPCKASTCVCARSGTTSSEF